MANKAILVYGDDWEGLYVNGKLVDEGHTLNEGSSRIKYFCDLAKKYNFNLDEMREQCLCYDDNYETSDLGNFPKNIDEFIGTYDY